MGSSNSKDVTVGSKSKKVSVKEHSSSNNKDKAPETTTVPFTPRNSCEVTFSPNTENTTTTTPTKIMANESVVSFDNTHPTRREDSSTNDPVMVTDALTDVRLKYHINPKELGHGHYGVVRKCMNRETGEWFAIKSIKKSKVSKFEVLKREVEILKEVKHPNIIKLIEIHEDTKYLHLITELCTGGELFDRIISKTQSEEGHFSERDAANLTRDILDAINYCHTQKQIVHRDLKPENFLYLNTDEDSPIKIIDFGLSRYDDQVMGIMKTKVGTPYYVAPEVLNRQYTKSCDIWSIGVITYILLCGYPPFYGDSDTQIFQSVRTGIYDFPSPDWDTISQDAKDFIDALLQLDPKKRPTTEQALSSKWIMDNCFTRLKPPSAANGKERKVSYQSRRSVTFTNYYGMEKLKKAALTYIATNLTQSEVGTLGDIFKDIDRDGDGTLSLMELDDALSHKAFPPTLKNQLIELRKDLDVSGKLTLNWKDFLAATMDKTVSMQEDKIRLAFDHFRRSDQNCLDMADLIQLFGGTAQAMEIMGAVDLDQDGRISYSEFKNMMSSTNPLTNDMIM